MVILFLIELLQTRDQIYGSEQANISRTLPHNQDITKDAKCSSVERIEKPINLKSIIETKKKTSGYVPFGFNMKFNHLEIKI